MQIVLNRASSRNFTMFAAYSRRVRRATSRWPLYRANVALEPGGLFPAETQRVRSSRSAWSQCSRSRPCGAPAARKSSYARLAMSAWLRDESDDAVDVEGVVGDWRVRVRVMVDCVVWVLLGIHTSRDEATRAYRHNTRTIRIVQSSVLTIACPTLVRCFHRLPHPVSMSFDNGWSARSSDA